jgi:uncharacterized protein YmfQ (DUF2313 family)
MASCTEKYKKLLINLLPQGKLWEPGEQPTFDDFLLSIAEELCRAETRVWDLLREADPRQTDEMVDDWERLLGLPDPCIGEITDLQERRDKILQELTNIGGLSETYYEFVATQLGFPTTDVFDNKNFRAGFSVAGDPLTNYFNRVFEAGDTAGTPLREIGWRFYFTVDLPITAAEVFEAGDVAGTPLREFTNPIMECTIRKLKPAHSAVFFRFI